MDNSCTFPGITLLVLLLTGCGSHGQHETLLAALGKEGARKELPVSVAPLMADTPLRSVETDSLQLPFQIPQRIPEISKFPCTSCHTQPLNLMNQAGNKRAHWDIELKHAPDVVECLTCHDSRKLDVLTLIRGSQIDFDQSYRVCAQCHFNQFNDWVGGAHGKRLGGWAPPRIIMTCVQCHNPHQPRWNKRWPAHPGASLKTDIGD